MPLDENVFKGEFVVTQGDFIPVGKKLALKKYDQFSLKNISKREN